MILHNIFIIVIVLIALKFISLLMVFILKLSFIKKDEDEQMTALKKVTFLEWGDEYGEWHILPTIVIAFNGGFSIDYHWLKIHYSQFWKVVTFGEENDYAKYLIDKNKNK